MAAAAAVAHRKSTTYKQQSTASFATSTASCATPDDIPLPSFGCRARVKRWYENDRLQITVAALIVGNFIVSATFKEIKVRSSIEEGFEYFFNTCFTIELLVNMFGNAPFEFWRSAWNWFDFFIVLVSLISLLFPKMPGITVLRLFRAFRVFRLFKRIRSLKLIVDGIMYATPSVSASFCVLILIMSIWAILCVNEFKDARPEDFGTFAKAMVTLFQIMTFDSWCSAIARDLILRKGVMAAVILLSFLLVNSIILTNCVVAQVADGFLAAKEELAGEEEKRKTSNTKVVDYQDPAMEKPATKQAFKDVPTKNSQGCTNISENKDAAKPSNKGSLKYEAVTQETIPPHDTKARFSTESMTAQAQLQKFQDKVKSSLREMDEELEDLCHQLHRIRQTARFAKLRPVLSALPEPTPPGFVEESLDNASNSSECSFHSCGKRVEVDIFKRDPTLPGLIGSAQPYATANSCDMQGVKHALGSDSANWTRGS